MIGNEGTFWEYLIGFPFGVMVAVFEYPMGALLFVVALIFIVLMWKYRNKETHGD